MIKKIIPNTVTNHYAGPRVVHWVFLGITGITLGRSLAHMLLPDGGAQSIATIPLHGFSQAAADVVVGMFAQWGMTQLFFGLMYVLVLWRYQSLIPLMWFFYLSGIHWKAGPGIC